MTNVAGKDVTDELFDVLGYDHSNKKVKIGALAENTHPQIRDKIEDMLEERVGFSETEAKKVVDKSWMDTPEDMKVKMTGDVHDMFERLKASGVKIAICTSDSREGTHSFLESQNLEGLVDIIMCGDDAHGKPKPNPHNANYICQKLGVKPSETIMVGDTPADTLMGQHADLGLTVGVLTGVGDKDDLIDADVIVHDVAELVELILPESIQQNKPELSGGRIHQVTTRGISKIARGAMWAHMVAGRSGSGLSGGQSSSRAFSTSANANGGGDLSHVIVGAGSAGCVLANRLTEERSE